MALYQKQFTKPYLGGYVNKPQKTTPVTAEILNMQDQCFAAVEDFLTSDDVGFKKGLTVGGARSGSVGESSLALYGNTASGNHSSAFGNHCTTAADNSLSFGNYCAATGANSCAGGSSSNSTGVYSCAIGVGVIASGQAQHAQGKFNISDTENKYAHIVGGGTSNADRKNIHTLDWQGNAVFAGDVTNGNGISLDGLMALIGTTGQLRTIVEALPEENISTSTIYMVPKESGAENDIFNEYINVDGTTEGWEFIGNSAVDLSNYYTKSEVNELLAEYDQAFQAQISALISRIEALENANS